MPQLIVNQALAYTSPPPQSFSETEFEQWGFSQGQWTWTVAGEEQAVSFGLEQGELVLSADYGTCLLYTSPSPRDRQKSRMPSSA